MDFRSVFKALGPGLLFAGAAIGTSHLVLSTQSGARYGWALIGLIVAANVFKYPFFEFGIRYAASTGKDLLEGYKRRSPWFLWAYLFMTALTMFTLVAALASVSGGLLVYLLKIDTSWSTVINAVILVLCTATLIIGKYRYLETGLKWVMGCLTLAVCVALLAALVKGPAYNPPSQISSPWGEDVGIALIIALLGWMPTAVEASSWSSLWAVEKYKDQGNVPFKESILEYNLGYVFTALLGLGFLAIGVYSMYGSGIAPEKNPVLFSGQLEQMFVSYLGSWSALLIILAAFLTIFSSLFTAQDALARVCARGLSLSDTIHDVKKWTIYFLIILAIGAFILLFLFSTHLGDLLFLATTISFLISPCIGILNIIVIQSDDLDETQRPSRALLLLSYVGLLFLSIFAVFYVYQIWIA